MIDVMNLSNEQKLGILRHVLTCAGGILATLGKMSESDANQIVGILMVVIPTIWSVVSKRNNAGRPTPPAPTGGGNAVEKKLVEQMCMICVVVTGLLILTGCETLSGNRAAQTVDNGVAGFQSESNNPTTFCTFELSGVSEIKAGPGSNIVIRAYSYKTPKSMIAQNPTVWEKLIDGSISLGKWFIGFSYGGEVIKAMNAQQTHIVTTEKLVPVEGAVVP
jgi:hypothetical protein